MKHWTSQPNGHKKQCKKLNPFACDQCKGVLKHRATCPTLNLSANKLKEKAAHQKSNNKEARTARATRNRSKHTSSSSTHTLPTNTPSPEQIEDWKNQFGIDIPLHHLLLLLVHLIIHRHHPFLFLVMTFIIILKSTKFNLIL